MLKTRTDGLVGLQLDYAVLLSVAPETFKSPADLVELVARYPYSTNPLYGGPIIERDKIATMWAVHSHQWVAYWSHPSLRTTKENRQVGPTLLIAAMRCLVTNTFGDAIELPKELL